MSGFFGMVRQDGKPVEERLLQRISDELTFSWKCLAPSQCRRLLHMDAHRARASGSTATGHVEEQIFSLGRSSFRRSPAASTTASTGEFLWPAGIDQRGLALTCMGEMGSAALEHVMAISLSHCGMPTNKTSGAPGTLSDRGLSITHTSDKSSASAIRSEFCAWCRKSPGNWMNRFLGDFLIEGWNVDPSRSLSGYPQASGRLSGEFFESHLECSMFLEASD
jgi:hypothetical protein